LTGIARLILKFERVFNANNCHSKQTYNQQDCILSVIYVFPTDAVGVHWLESENVVVYAI